MSSLWQCKVCGLVNNFAHKSCKACFHAREFDEIMERDINFKRSIVNGYCMIYCKKYIPLEITKLCILYCFIFDEFDLKQISSPNIEIKGLNNTIAIIKQSSNYSKYYTECISTNNLITSYGHYHWAFKISTIGEPVGMVFGFIQKDSSLLAQHHINPKNCIFHIYLDKDKKTVFYVIGNKVNIQKRELDINDMDPIRLQIVAHIYPTTIRFIDVNTITIEMIEYNDSNWYQNLLNPMEHIGYAQCIYDVDEKIKHYEIALQSYPYSEAWNNKYLHYLAIKQQFDIAYNHIIQYKKGQKSMAKIAKYYYRNGNNEYALQLFKLLNDKILIENDLYFAAGYVCSEFHEDQKAIDFYQLYLDQHRNDNADHVMQRKLLCIGNMAKQYIHSLHDKEKALALFHELDDETLKNNKFSKLIGYCYDSIGDHDKALFYYKLALDKDTTNIWILTRICNIYDDLKNYENVKKYLKKCEEIGGDKDFDCMALYGRFLSTVERNYEESTKYLLKALNVATQDYDKDNVYTILGINAYKMGNIENAIKYTKLSIKCSNSNLNSAIRMSNMGKYYYKLEEYNESFKYLSKAIQIDPNSADVIGNYGIILYYLQRYDASIVYLEKCVSIAEDVSDPELLPDSLLIYAQILFDRNKYQQSIQKCFQAQECDEFIDYSNQHKIYYLMSKIFSKLNQLEDAMKYLEKAKESKQNHCFYTKEIEKLQQMINYN